MLRLQTALSFSSFLLEYAQKNVEPLTSRSSRSVKAFALPLLVETSNAKAPRRCKYI